MQLIKFKENKNNRLLIVIIFIIFTFIGIGIHWTYASFSETKIFNVIKGTVKYEGSGDVYIAAYIDGVKTNEFPSNKDYLYDEEQSNCTNDAVLNFDLSTWKASVTEVSKPNTKCNIYFNSRPIYTNKIYEMMVNLAQTDTTNLAYDNTSDNNLRYIGADPNNYVTFNGELWRIIGAFNNIDDGSGRKEWRTKIIRNINIGSKAWDTSVGINNGAGINEWSKSDTKVELNETYLNTFSLEAKKMVENTIWHTGATPKNQRNNLSNEFYELERSNNIGKVCDDNQYCTDTVTRTTTWLGKIGLMYPSDYGYAVGGSTRNVCLTTPLGNWTNNSNCYNNDWLHSGAYQWTITPSADSTYGSHVFGIASGGYIADYNASGNYSIRPTLYLAPNVMITVGSGTSSDPYQLGLQ